MVYIDTGYTNPCIIYAAKKCGMKVIEIQHCTITRYHLGYSDPNAQIVADLLPDEILCYGQFWIDETTFSPHIMTKVTGLDYMSEQLSQTHDKEKGLVLFASQGPVSQGLFDCAKDFAKLRPDLNIVYSLHPSEMMDHYESDDLPKNLQLSSKDMGVSTYDWMVKAEYQVSVSSTTLIEGLCMGCKIAVVKLPSHEYMHGVIDKGHAIMVETAEELAKRIEDTKIIKDVGYYYS